MKKIILLCFLIIIILCLMPPMDGYLFRNIYYQRYAFYQQQIQRANKNFQLQLQSYDLGWFSSNAHLQIITTHPQQQFPLQPFVFNIYSTIHHGPLVFMHHGIRLAYAYVETTLHLPDLFRAFIPQQRQGFMQMDSLVTLGGNTWKNHYTIPAITLANIAKWEGLNGNVVVEIRDNQPEKVKSKLIFGKINITPPLSQLPNINIDPINIQGDAIRQPNLLWDTRYHLELNNIMATWRDGRIFNLQHLNFNSSCFTKNNLYNAHNDLSIDNIQLPKSFPINYLSNLKANFLFNNLNVEGLKIIKTYFISNQNNSALLAGIIEKILTPTSNALVDVSLNTESGPIKIKLTSSILPHANQEIIDYLNIEFNARFPQTVLTQVLKNYLEQQQAKQLSTNSNTPPLPQATSTAAATTPKTTTAATTATTSTATTSTATTQTTLDSQAQANIIIDHMLQQGVIVQDQTDYVIAYNKKGTTTILNGKTLSDNDLEVLLSSITKDMNAPSFNSPSSSSEVDDQEYHCYWMENYSGQYRWISAPVQTKAQCFALDSCNGGLKQSNGGCYKWAKSPDSQAQPWN